MRQHKSPKAMTLRLDPYKAAQLEAIARTEDRTVSDAVRDAIEEYIATRRSNEAFIDRARKQREDEAQVWESLVS